LEGADEFENGYGILGCAGGDLTSSLFYHCIANESLSVAVSVKNFLEKWSIFDDIRTKIIPELVISGSTEALQRLSVL